MNFCAHQLRMSVSDFRRNFNELELCHLKPEGLSVGTSNGAVSKLLWSLQNDKHSFFFLSFLICCYSIIGCSDLILSYFCFGTITYTVWILWHSTLIEYSVPMRRSEKVCSIWTYLGNLFLEAILCCQKAVITFTSICFFVLCQRLWVLLIPCIAIVSLILTYFLNSSHYH